MIEAVKVKADGVSTWYHLDAPAKTITIKEQKAGVVVSIPKPRAQKEEGDDNS